MIEKNTAPDHQIIITGHELRHLELGHCHADVSGTPVAARLLSHDAELKQAIESVLALAGRHGPTPAGQDAARHAKQEQEVEQYGLALAHAVRHLLPGGQAPPPDLQTPAGRIEAALGNRGTRG
ncbi:hypothetical protein [Streptomyces sp. NPDC002952]|uniref:hypothetical protein n=1 Tax=Streptomyces sp. NPDC002952 TaxID=3364673 RepID=UPI0036A8E7DA